MRKLRAGKGIETVKQGFARLKAYARTKTRKEWTIFTGSFLGGALSVILFTDMVIMPLYLRKGYDVSVPDLIGKTWPEGYKTARKSRLYIVTDGAEYHETVGKDRIASQRPAPGTKVKSDRRIHVVISRGQKYVTIPDLVGKNLSEAEKLIHEAGLIISEKRLRSSVRFPSGSVMRQYPKAGVEVQSGAGINLHIVK
ncbi:MAG: PASTA domain-containing protein [Candidatus Latescibacterota bacterium]